MLDLTGMLERQLELLAALPVVDVWGIGSCWGQMLTAEGIDTALKLREQPNCGCALAWESWDCGRCLSCAVAVACPWNYSHEGANR
ncbi:hypothetical protein [Chroococcidiopsis sp. SAG 2025]|uniref:hypothetical protein n=1 Tax=Chroococcidiopsis sp. SAG 2025 TaxID=171389 RepID=UPI002936F326|nr:hypothetical protein [Chroococcidiopsis sp. SAG 2025]